MSATVSPNAAGGDSTAGAGERDPLSLIDSIFEDRGEGTDPSPVIPVLPEHTSLELLDDSTRASYLASLRGYFDYRLSGYAHREKVFGWQLLSSKIIFIVVVLLMAAGIYFSGVQFHASLRRAKRTGSPGEAELTEVVASMKGIKVSSPVLGVIILMISLLFFYLYLVHVYPIESIF